MGGDAASFVLLAAAESIFGISLRTSGLEFERTGEVGTGSDVERRMAIGGLHVAGVVPGVDIWVRETSVGMSKAKNRASEIFEGVSEVETCTPDIVGGVSEVETCTPDVVGGVSEVAL